MGSARAQLVTQHVERIPRTILADHPTVLREYVKGKRGVYALYKGTRLYYVGLASNLRGRLKTHLRDRHATLWDFFSLYLTKKDEHLRELEALVLRITMPSGNKSKTKFSRSTDLRRFFKRRIVESQRTEIEHLFGLSRKKVRARTASGGKGRVATLAPYITRRTRIRFKYKGVLYRAIVRANGLIRFRRKTFTSPSMAAREVSGRAMNGWYEWKYEASPGNWERLKKLRGR